MEIIKWSHMSIKELKEELEKLKENKDRKNNFFFQFKIGYLESYIEERIRQREVLIPKNEEEI